MRKQKNGQIQRILFLFAVSVFIAGCGSLHQDFMLAPSVGSVPQLPAKVNPIENSSGTEIPFDYVSYYQTELETALSKQGIHPALTNNERSLILESSIIRYEAGNAFKRWLMPGYGKTAIDVQVVVKDSTNNELIATIDVGRTISAGGGFTIGAYRTVFKDIAKAVAKQLKKEMK